MSISGPIYIGGVSYSGKTQLRFLLSNHPKIVISRRTYLWREFNNAYGDLAKEENLEKCLNAILRLDSIQQLNPNRKRIRQEFCNGDTSYGRLFAIIHQQFAESVGKSRWGIQIGMVEKDAKTLFLDDPKTKIIHMMRDPFERISESISTSNHRKLSIGLETDLWRESARLAKENIKNYPNHYKIIRWEDLTDDIDRTLEDICLFLEENFEPEMLSTELLSKMGLVVRTKSNSNQRSLVDNHSNTAYQLTRNAKTYISEAVRSELKLFGYTRKANKLQVDERLKYLSMDYPAFFMGGLSKTPLKVLRNVKKKMKLKLKRNYLWQKIT